MREQCEESCLRNAEHLGVRALRRVEGWADTKSHVSAVMEVTKEGFVLCRVVSCCVVSYVCCKGLTQSPGTAELLCHKTLWPEGCQAGGPQMGTDFFF